jgi:hypothetical protein
MSGATRILVRAPEGWVTAPLAPLDLSQTPDVEVLQWQAWGSKGSGEAVHLVAACFGGETRAWTDEAEPMVLDRLRAVVSSTALRVARVGGLRVQSTERAGHVISERLEGAGDAQGELVARAFLGFVDAGKATAGHLVGCFVLCVADPAGCRSSVDGAAMEGAFVPSPRPTMEVRAILAMVHHPSATYGSMALVCGLLGVIAIVTRKRPRTK